MQSFGSLWVILIIIGTLVLGIWLWVKVSRGENGERWAKRRSQGPFVPLSAEEIAADEQRSSDLHKK
jgi:hypothetical protein